MQSNLTQLQYQQLQIQQQQQRLASMMQQKQRGFHPPLPPPPPLPPQQHQQQAWMDNNSMSKQQQLFQQQQQQMRMMRPPPPSLPLHLQQHQQQSTIPLPIQQAPLPPQAPHTQAIVPVINNVTPPTATNATITVIKTDLQKKNLEQYEHRDEVYQSVLNTQHKRHVELAQSKKRSIEMASMERRTRMQPNGGGPLLVFGPGYGGYGNGKTGTRTKMRFPQQPLQHHHHDSITTNNKKKRCFRFSLEALKEQAAKEDTLVPIRIELEHEGYKLRDTFTWNLNESLITPEQFADIICDDLKLPQSIFSDQITKSIKEQLDDYNLNASSMMKEEQEDSSPTLDALCDTHTNEGGNSSSKGIELRTVIKLDITVGNRELVDQFEWDISCPRNSPEEFANTLSTDLGLGGEFKTAIAHSIREQIHVYIKSLLLVGYEFNSTSTIDDEIRHSFLPRLQNIIRPSSSLERFTPSITELSDAAIEKMEKDRMREARRKRRGTRARRGIILPDREPQKTHRTGFAVPPEQELTDEQFMNQQLLDQPATHSKRGAALRARMNIAAEAADTGDDFRLPTSQQQSSSSSSGVNLQGVISLGSGNSGSMSKFQSFSDHQRYIRQQQQSWQAMNINTPQYR